MIAFAFRFPAGRYHATPWGRHANEADVAWPPEPARILRALIAIWYRKADHARFSEGLLSDLVDRLSAEAPVFRLPDEVHAHIRAYMPAPSDKKLIYDAFLRLDPDAELIVAWPSVNLKPKEMELTAHLLERLGYLGRAESWASARIIEDWDGEVNASPRGVKGALLDDNTEPTDVAVPLSPVDWAERRTQLLDSAKNMTPAKKKEFIRTLPERLADALAVDTGDWQKAGWSSPPPLRTLTYDRPPVGPLPKKSQPRCLSSGQPGSPEVARFVLAGRPQPRIEDVLKIGEIARLALMSMSKSRSDDPPPEFSGRHANGPQRDDPGHAHAFFLPEDADGDGLIDHLVIYCRHGFSHAARQDLDRLNRLWLAHGRAKDDGERGRKEWRLALEDIAAPEKFADGSSLLRPSCEWVSMTPYLMPWYAKRNFGAVDQITREIRQRGTFPDLSHTEIDQSDRHKRTATFHRIRSRGGLIQPDKLGSFLTLTFAEPVVGPLAFGFACHYGLGLFTATGK